MLVRIWFEIFTFVFHCRYGRVHTRTNIPRIQTNQSVHRIMGHYDTSPRPEHLTEIQHNCIITVYLHTLPKCTDNKSHFIFFQL